MAFTRAEYPHLFDLMQTVAGYPDAETRAIGENFILEERLTAERQQGYAGAVGQPVDVDDWADKHLTYVDQRIYHRRRVRGRQPETFAQANAPNWLPDLETARKLVRVENLAAIQKHLNLEDDPEVVVKQFERYIENKTDSDAVALVERILRDYNTFRDQRPTLVSFWGEVKGLLEHHDDDWPNQLRDRLGLGHLDPGETGAIPILVLWYRVEEVRGAVEKNFATIPTVLDGEFSPFFCPAPKEGWHKGQTVDLSPGGEEDFNITSEILHRAIDYTLEHVYRVGWITKPPGRTCEAARRIHFLWLGDDFSNFGLLPTNEA